MICQYYDKMNDGKGFVHYKLLDLYVYDLPTLLRYRL